MRSAAALTVNQPSAPPDELSQCTELFNEKLAELKALQAAAAPAEAIAKAAKELATPQQFTAALKIRPSRSGTRAHRPVLCDLDACILVVSHSEPAPPT